MVVQRTIDEIVQFAKRVIEDPSLSYVREIKKNTGKKVVGFFPVYTPVPLIHSAGLLPVGLNGGGNQIEIDLADARFGSFICSIVKSTLELGFKEHLNVLDGMIFHSICDAARNLASLFNRNFSSDTKTLYIHFPQNPESPSSPLFLKKEYEKLLTELEDISGKKTSDEDIKTSISLYNENQRLLKNLYEFRKKNPHILPTHELYSIMRLGNFIPVEEHNQVLMSFLKELPHREGKHRDYIRVMLEGSFCEQPPLELIQILDDVGCHLMDDDFLIGRRWFTEDISIEGDPLLNLASAYFKKSTLSSVRHNGKIAREEKFLQKFKDSSAQAVVFLYAKFCEPGLFDYVLYKNVLEKEKIPYIILEFEEKMWNFDKIQLEMETFVESLIFE